MTRYALIIPNGVLQNSSDVFAILDPDTGGAETFSVPLNATGVAADGVTHWGAYTPLEPATVNALTTMTTQQFKDYANALAGTRGRATINSATAFKNSLLMSAPDANFWTFATAQGLQSIADYVPAAKNN